MSFLHKAVNALSRFHVNLPKSWLHHLVPDHSADDYNDEGQSKLAARAGTRATVRIECQKNRATGQCAHTQCPNIEESQSDENCVNPADLLA